MHVTNRGNIVQNLNRCTVIPDIDRIKDKTEL